MTYFVNRDKEAEAARQARLVQALDKADAAFKAGNLTLAAASYRTALVYLPTSADRLDRIVANIEASGKPGRFPEAQPVAVELGGGVAHPGGRAALTGQV